MTRRRTSVIGPVPAHRTNDAALDQRATEVNPDPGDLELWTLGLARHFALEQVRLDQVSGNDAGDGLSEHFEVVKSWRIANRLIEGNPAQSAKRSTVYCYKRPNGDWVWRKTYNTDGSGWSNQNEFMVLTGIGNRGEKRLRQHIGHLASLSKGKVGSQIQVLETMDVGPNLNMWQSFSPCDSLNNTALQWPLFADPNFLARLARQALLALEELAKAKVVHGDLKPANLCLSMPENISSKGKVRKGFWSLHEIKIRLIDFEFSFSPELQRRAFPFPDDGNENMSPFAKARHRVACSMSAADQNLSLLAIDWGADLWSLGDMLLWYSNEAVEFFKAYRQAVVSKFGQSSSVLYMADTATHELLHQIGLLRGIAEELQQQDRPANHAGQTTLTERTELPHQKLRLKLDENFPNLGEGASHRIQRVDFQFFNPELAPGQEPTKKTIWAGWEIDPRIHGVLCAAASQSGSLVSRLIRTSRGAAEVIFRRRHPALLWLVLLATPIAGWVWLPESKQQVLAVSTRLAKANLEGYQEYGRWYQQGLGRLFLRVSEELQPGTAADYTLAATETVPEASKAPTFPLLIEPRELRDRALRAVVQLADLTSS